MFWSDDKNPVTPQSSNSSYGTSCGKRTAPTSSTRPPGQKRSYAHLAQYEYRHYAAPAIYRSYKRAFLMGLLLLLAGLFSALLVKPAASIFSILILGALSYSAWRGYLLYKECAEHYTEDDVLLAAGKEGVWFADFPAFRLYGPHKVAWGDIIFFDVQENQKEESFLRVSFRSSRPVWHRRGRNWSQALHRWLESSSLPRVLRDPVIAWIRTYLPVYSNKLTISLYGDKAELKDALVRCREHYENDASSAAAPQ